jgi:hypothetical protein
MGSSSGTANASPRPRWNAAPAEAIKGGLESWLTRRRLRITKRSRYARPTLTAATDQCWFAPVADHARSSRVGVSWS